MSNPYQVLNASAGSGKTHSLVEQLLIICLDPNQPESAIQNILALTFTNKAATEMKERILDWLKDFTKTDSKDLYKLISIQKKLNEKGVDVTVNTLQKRAQKVLDYILHHYSAVQIGTIDKFNAKLVRSFAYELGLSQNFNLEINAEPYLMEAVDKVLDEIGLDNNVSGAFLDFVHYTIEQQKKIKLNTSLYESTKEYIKDKHYFRLTENKNFDWESYEEVKKKLRDEIGILKKENQNLITTAQKLILDNDLDAEDFSGGANSSIVVFLDGCQAFYRGERATIPLVADEEKTTQRYLKGASAKSKNRQNDIQLLLPQLLEIRNSIIQNYIASQKKEKILHALLPLKVHKEIRDKLSTIEEENDLVMLSKFNILIHENLLEEPAAFIYEKVGAQFNHYFFDEFQDTSTLQWQNFLPLRDNTITTENMSFTLVGDPKQSIYRFRGGESKLMTDIILGNEVTPTKAKVIQLPYNWRSAKNIVDFNNRLYQYIAEHSNFPEVDIFRNAQQEAKSEMLGRVRINLIEKAKVADFYETVTERMIYDIQQCLDNGFRFSDITILCRSNQEIRQYSKLLSGIKVMDHQKEIYIKTISEQGLTLDLSPILQAVIYFLKWENQPNANEHFCSMMYYLNASGRIKISDYTEEMQRILALENRQKMIDYVAEHYCLTLYEPKLPRLNLYYFIEYYVQSFSVQDQEMDYLLNFLELVYNFAQNNTHTLKDFLHYWEDEGKETSIQASENTNAIQIMTIHKSKGLEFPVVFLPMKNAESKRISGWLDVEEKELNAVIIDGFQKDLENYDPEMKLFNQKHFVQNTIDQLCMQYVATTRAVEQLYLYLEKPGKTQYLQIEEFVHQMKPENQNYFDLYEVDPEQLLKKTKVKNNDYQTLRVKNLQYQQQSGNIKIATPSKNYQNRNTEVRIGILLHEILSKIKYKNDITKVIRTYIMDGILTRHDAEIIQNRINAIIYHPKYAPYFEKNISVLTEKEILISEAEKKEYYRPDRIVELNNGLCLIDYKTGKETKQYQKQIDGYQLALEKIGKIVIAKEIIYL